jgi:hypothetical protein
MLEFLLEAFGELLFAAVWHMGDACIQELLRWTREVL